MSTSTELRAGALKIEHEAKVILTEMESADETRSSDLKAQFDKAIAKAEEKYSLADQLERMESRQAALESVADTARRPLEDRAVEAVRAGESKADAERRAFLQYARTGEMRAMATTDAAVGAVLIHPSYANNILDTIKTFGGVQTIANIIETDDGSPWTQTTQDSTSYVASVIAENTAVDDTKTLAFGTKILNAYTYTAGAIRVSNQMLQDSHFDLNTNIIDKMSEAFARGMALDFVTGSGSSKPQGVLTGITAANATINATNVGNAVVDNGDDLFKLQAAIDQYHTKNGTYVMNHNTLFSVRTIKDGTGRYVWQPGLSAGMPGFILDRPYVIDNAMPDVASGAVPILFGNFSRYYIRMVKSVGILRLTERYAEYNQTGFMGYARADAKVMDSAAFVGLKLTH